MKKDPRRTFCLTKEEDDDEDEATWMKKHAGRKADEDDDDDEEEVGTEGCYVHATGGKVTPSRWLDQSAFHRIFLVFHASVS